MGLRLSNKIFLSGAIGYMIGIVGLALTLISCTKSGDTCPEELTIIPGECLNSSELMFTELSINDNYGPKGFVFPCLFNKVDVVTPAGPPFASADYKRIPPDEIYESFGTNAKTVKSSYDSFWRDIFIHGKGGGPGPFYISTIVYESGLELLANKDFAGFKAGENIAKGAKPYQKGDDAAVLIELVTPSDYLGIPSTGGYYLYSYGITVRVPLKDFSIVEEDVTFHLSVPVKIGLLLTWFNDKITDPLAPFPYREDTLTCTFTINKGLH